MRGISAVLLLAVSLAGCANQAVRESPWLVQGNVATPKHCDPLTADQELVLSLAQETASTGRRHAALANLERLPADIPQVRLSKARLLRVLGYDSEAEQLYRSLLRSCLDAEANHGLGQIAASRSEYSQAQQHLRVASSLSPASDTIRNDLGVVYMHQRRMSEAQFELLTALELNDESKRAARNLLAVLLYQGNSQAAQRLLEAKGLTAEDRQQAERRVAAMRVQDGAVPAAVSAPAPAPQPLATPEPAGTAAIVSAAALPAAAPVSAPVQAPTAVVTPKPLPETVRARVGVETAPAPTATRMSVAEAARSWGVTEPPAARDAGEVVRQSTAMSGRTADGRKVICRASSSEAGGLAVLKCAPERE